MELKLGCTVWFFDGEKIVKGIFNDKFYKPKPLGFNVDVPIASVDVISKELVDGKVKTRYYACLPHLLFESREALCEHYRKIFGQTNFDMKWISVKKSTPNTPRKVLCVDAIGNYFIGYYTKRDGWMVSMYDEPGKSNEYNPDVTHWSEIKPPKRGFFSRILQLSHKINK